MPVRLLAILLCALCACRPQRGSAPAGALKPAAWYYSDLGPNAVDISQYPPEQRKNYAVVVKQCAVCHNLARTINISVVGREYWDKYIASMAQYDSYASQAQIPPEDALAIVDFLEFDAQVRKVLRKTEFDALTAELQRRFAAQGQQH